MANEAAWTKISGHKRVNHEHGNAQVTNIQAAGANYAKILKVGYRGYINEARQEMEKVKEAAKGRDFTDDEKEKLLPFSPAQPGA